MDPFDEELEDFKAQTPMKDHTHGADFSRLFDGTLPGLPMSPSTLLSSVILETECSSDYGQLLQQDEE
jgi:hypothetical protein